MWDDSNMFSCHKTVRCGWVLVLVMYVFILVLLKQGQSCWFNAQTVVQQITKY